MPENKKNAKVAISGYYGFGNCGDEAVLLSIISCLRQLKPDTRIVVFSNDPSMTRSAYGVAAVNRWDPVKVAYELMTCRLLISGGGSLLQDETSTKSLYYYMGIIRLATFLKKKVMIYSQGIGPLNIEKHRARVARLLNRCHTITVRDAVSASLLGELGVKTEISTTCDPVMAFGIDDIDGAQIAGIEKDIAESGILDSADGNRKPLMLAAIRCWKDNSHFGAVAEFLDTVIRSGWDVLLVSAHFPVDAEAIDGLRHLMATQPHSLKKSVTARQFLALTARADMVFSMRLHGLICGFTMGTPVIGISYDPKVDGFMAQAGLQKYCLPYDSFDAEAAKRLFEELDAESGRRLHDGPGAEPHISRQGSEARRTQLQELAWDAAKKAAQLLM